MGTQLLPAQWSSDKPEKLPALIPASFHDSDEEDPAQVHVPVDIYQHFGLPPGTPICLDSLHDPAPGEKPAYTYATLVKLAIWSSPQRKLTLSGIYEALERRFSWFRECENPSAWKTSIRHSLSLMSVFVKLPTDIHVPGKGCNWTVDFSKGDGYKRPRKRGPKNKHKALAPDAPPPEPSASNSAQLCSECEPSPLDPPDFSNTSAETFQEAEEHAKHALPPYKSSSALAAAIPDPQFRHYRMRTYLYPTIDGVPAPGPSEEVWGRVEEQVGETAEQANPDPPVRPNRTRNYRASRRSDPIASMSRRNRKTNRRTLNSQSPEEYFCPSPASYHAYYVASAPYRNSYTYHGNDASTTTTKTSSECSSTAPSRGPSHENVKMKWRHATAKDFSKQKGERSASEPIVEISLSAPLPSESEFEEEDN